jgi:hypothetical protein
MIWFEWNGFEPMNADFLPDGRGVAQPGSAHAWGACGRRFKSGRPDQPKILYLQELSSLHALHSGVF